MGSNRTQSGGLVYSTDFGRMCPGCSKPVAQCTCKTGTAAIVNGGTARIWLETKGRKGKGVTVVSGLPLQPNELLTFSKELKQRCGSGGTVKDGQVEIQGDHRSAVSEELAKRGWKFKTVGRP